MAPEDSANEEKAGSASAPEKASVDQSLPQGLEFFRLAWRVEDECEGATDSWIPQAGEKAPECFARLGTVVSLLYQAATCSWGCAGGDHTVERLIARATTSTLASIRLLRFGHYDDALSLARRAGELGNLMFLFSQKADLIDEWRGMTPEARWSRFGFAKVREELRRIGAPVPVEEPRYRDLTAVGAHGTARTGPQAWDLHAAVGGGYLQPTGALTALNETAIPAVIVALAATKLLQLDAERRRRLKDAAMALAEVVGGVQITTLRELRAKLREERESGNEPPLPDSGEASRAFGDVEKA